MQRSVIGCLILCCHILGTTWCPSVRAAPQRQHGLHYTEPAGVWDEAMPLGNGLLGALVWGDGRPLRVSLDRTDLWDLRPVPEFESPDYSYKTMRQWVKEGRIENLHRLYDFPYRESYSGTIRLFPAIPAKWREVSFRGLRAEGAFVVSAARKDGRTEVVQVLSEAGGVLSLENPFGEDGYSLTGAEPGSVKTRDQELLLDTRPGQTVTFSASTKRLP